MGNLAVVALRERDLERFCRAKGVTTLDKYHVSESRRQRSALAVTAAESDPRRRQAAHLVCVTLPVGLTPACSILRTP
jgi:hypothetical protein